VADRDHLLVGRLQAARQRRRTLAQLSVLVRSRFELRPQIANFGFEAMPYGVRLALLALDGVECVLLQLRLPCGVLDLGPQLGNLAVALGP
jgi:hypothetical protein